MFFRSYKLQVGGSIPPWRNPPQSQHNIEHSRDRILRLRRDDFTFSVADVSQVECESLSGWDSMMKRKSLSHVFDVMLIGD